MTRKIEKIRLDKTEDEVREDLKKYHEKALAIGAARAKIVSASDIPVDDRVPLKCQIPRCFGYGTGAHCPPNTLKPQELREHLKDYHWALFFIKEVPPEVIIRDRKTIKERIDAYLQVFDIVSEIESMAFHDGYYLSFGLAAGSCRHSLCSQHKTCRVLEGDRCRHSLKARPSMEAVGIDVYQMVTKADWGIYPIGSSATADEIPKGTLAGIVIVH
jgi:predicted metal-binding protein